MLLAQYNNCLALRIINAGYAQWIIFWFVILKLVRGMPTDTEIC
jgi:hypothetical protein